MATRSASADRGSTGRHGRRLERRRDLDSGDDSATDTTEVIAVADLTVTIVDGETRILAGSGRHLPDDDQVGNAGPSDARRSSTRVTWPVGLTRAS